MSVNDGFWILLLSALGLLFIGLVAWLAVTAQREIKAKRVVRVERNKVAGDGDEIVIHMADGTFDQYLARRVTSEWIDAKSGKLMPRGCCVYLNDLRDEFDLQRRFGLRSSP